jgi:hypothetical protein
MINNRISSYEQLNKKEDDEYFCDYSIDQLKGLKFRPESLINEDWQSGRFSNISNNLGGN